MVAGETVPIWIPTAEGDEMEHGSSQIPKQEKGKTDPSAQSQQLIMRTRSVSASTSSEGTKAAEILEYGETGDHRDVGAEQAKN